MQYIDRPNKPQTQSERLNTASFGEDEPSISEKEDNDPQLSDINHEQEQEEQQVDIRQTETDPINIDMPSPSISAESLDGSQIEPQPIELETRMDIAYSCMSL